MLALARARTAQARWAEAPLSRRLDLVRQLRWRIATKATDLARLVARPNERPVAEKLVSEVLPLVDACRFLERRARGILGSQKFGARGRPLWLRGSSFVVERRPFGVVLVIGPRNYPLFLPAVQSLQALVAGNAVLLKPAEDCTKPLRWMADQLIQIGLPEDLVQVLEETPAAAQEAIRAGVDKVIFTGSSENGRQVLALLAEKNIPSVCELSGADLVIVRQDAELERAARAIVFGRRLNGGETCMAPAQVLVHRALESALLIRLRELGANDPEVVPFSDDEEALALARRSEFGLGASIFSADEAAATRLARRLPTGFVTINDLIVPTADPRFPFGGVRASGFGTTRGAEGLLEMTYPHVIARRHARWLPHLQEPQPGDEKIFAAYLRLAHGRGWSRWSSLGDLWQAARDRGLTTAAPSNERNLRSGDGLKTDPFPAAGPVASSR